MPLSSAEIAQMNGAFQGVAMQQQQYAGMIGQVGNVYGGGYQGSGGDRMMGGAMNMAHGVGAPLMSGAMGLLGLDPMHLGFRAGMSAFGAGAGIGGAALAGGAVALPLMAAGAAVKYAGNQMYTGAQQQLGLNQELRAGFNFRNQYGGQGFTRSDMSAIGGVVREMSEQFGPGGEIASFRELSGLAGKMGSMGFAQGVRDVKEFTNRFKDMVKTLKTMATDLGTTLEGAMEFAQAAKGSGVFGMGRTQAFTSMARQTSVSGGLAMSEVTGAASIGAQISRSIGGLGRQGAVAGMRTIGQIGTAQQMGILSEEDIYNVTGLTGAEGRQAYATSAMSSSASFLQSGRGRRLLASMAGKNGQLDERMVQQLLSGGMSIEETMRQSRSHLNEVGRANFIRNEGRLRGAAMERMGAFIPAMQLQEWAQSKGIDINNMDDRSMLFAQRQLSMGRDEVDQAVLMATNMPRILAQQQLDQRRDQYLQQATQARKQRGVEGVKLRFEQARETINSKLQHVGQQVLNAGSDSVDEFFNELFNDYVETYSKDIDSSYRAMMSGGATGRAAASRLGFGPSTTRNAAAGGPAVRAGATGRLSGQAAPDLAATLARGSQGTFGESLLTDTRSALPFLGTGQIGAMAAGASMLFGRGPTAETAKYFAYGQSGVSQMKAAGFDISGKSSAEIQAKLQQIDSMRRAAATGFDANAVAGGDFAKANFIRRAYAMDSVPAGGDDRMNATIKLIEETARTGTGVDAAEAKDMLTKLNGAASPEQKIALLSNFERKQGVTGEGNIANRYAVPGNVANLAQSLHGGFRSDAERNEAYAGALGIGVQEKEYDVKGYKVRLSAERGLAGGIRAGLSHAAGSLFGVPGIIMANKNLGRFSDRLAGLAMGTDEQRQAAGGYLASTEFRDMSDRLLSGDEVTRTTAIADLEKELADQGKVEAGDTRGAAIRQVKQKALNASRYNDFLIKNPKASDAEKENWARANKVDLQTVIGDAQGMDAISRRQRELDRAEVQKRARSAAKADLNELASLGVYDAASGKLSEGTAKALQGIGKGAEAFGDIALQLKKEQEAGIDIVGSGTLEKYQKSMASLSVKEKRQVAQEMGGVFGGQLGAEASIQERLERQSRRKGQAGAVADVLGIKISAKDLKGKTDEEIARIYAKELGVGADQQADILNAIRSKKDSGLAAQNVMSVLQDPKYQESQKKKALDQAEAENPLQAAIKKNGEKANALLEMIMKHSGATERELAEYNAKFNANNPEGGVKPAQSK